MQKNRTTWILLGLLLLLGLLYVLLVYRKQGGTVDPDEVAFAVKDTAGVTQIRLTEYQEGKTVSEVDLQRGDRSWTVNGKYSVNPNRMDILLESLARIQFRETLHPNARENAFKFLRRNHIRVYVEGKEGTRVYRVGPPTQDHRGTIVWLEGASEPYVAEIPGFEGYLKPRYSTQLDDYRENLLFPYRAEDLQRIELQSSTADSNVVLERTATGWNYAAPAPLDSFRLGLYLRNIGRTYAFAFAPDSLFPGLSQRLNTRKGDLVLRLTDRKNATRVIHLYKRTDSEDLYFGRIEGQRELVQVQRFVVDRFLQPRAFFEGKPGQFIRQ